MVMNNKRKIVALLLTMVMIFAQLPFGSAAQAAPASTVGEAVASGGINVVMFDIPGDIEAEIRAIEAEKPVTRAVLPGVNTGIDWSSYRADMMIDITAATEGAQKPPFYWEEILGAGPVEFELIVKDKNGAPVPTMGQKVSVTKNDLTDTNGQLQGIVKFPTKSRFYDDNGDRYKFGIVLPANILTAVQINSIIASGGFDNEVDPKVYTLSATLARIANSETTVEWHTANPAENKENPQLVGIFNDGNAAYEFDLPKTNGRKILRVDFKDIPGVSDPKVAVDELLAVTTDSAGSPNSYNVTVKNVNNEGKITGADSKVCYVTTTYDQITGGKVVVKEEMTVTFDAGAGASLKDANDAALASPHSVKLPYGETVGTDQLPVAVPPTGKNFQGWVTGLGTPEEKIVDFAQPIIANTAVTAKYGDNVIPVEDPAIDPKDGYHRVAFHPGANGAFATDPAYKLIADGTYKGQVHFDVLNGTAFGEVRGVMPKTDKITPNTGWFVKAVPANWNTQEDGTGTTLPTDTHTGAPGYAREDYYVQYSAYDDIIPGDQDKPDGYVTVTFHAGEGTFDPAGQTTSYHVNPLKKKTIGDLTKPGVKAPFGKQHTGWNAPDDTAIEGDMTVTAQYTGKDPIVDINPNDPDYVAVDFSAGSNGAFDPAANVKESVWALKGTKASDVFTYASLAYNDATGITVEPTHAFAEYHDDGTKVVDQDTVIPNAGVLYTAQYDKKIISVDEEPNNPDPEKYAKVTIQSGDHGNFGGDPAVTEKAYWVLKNNTVPIADVFTNAGLDIALNTGLTIDDGYIFDVWTPNDNITGNVTGDETFTATYKETTIPVTDPTTDPDVDYVRVTFSPGANGSLTPATGTTAQQDGTILLDVRKDTAILTKYVPGIEPNAGFAVKDPAWDADLTEAITAAKTITAQYQETTIPVTDPTDPIPDGYVRVTMNPGTDGTLTAAKDTTKQTNGTILLDVKKDTVILTQYVPTIVPNTGHAVAEEPWNPAITTPVTDTMNSFTAQYRETTIPVTDPTDPTPDGYVRVTMHPGTDGTLTAAKDTTKQLNGTILLDVKKDTAILTQYVPTIVPNIGHAVAEEPWNPAITTPVTDTMNSFTAQYQETTIPVTDPTDPTPDGYVRVTLQPGANGTFTAATGTKTQDDGTILLDVKKDTIVLDKYVPTVNAKDGWTATGWDPDIAKVAVTETQNTFTATYDQNVIETDPDDPKTPTGYVLVTFASGENGNFAGVANAKKAFNVKEGTPFKEVKAVMPTPAANDGYALKAEAWAPELQADAAATIAQNYVAQYDKQIIPVDEETPTNPDPDKYAKVTFQSGANGDFGGDPAVTEKAYWVLKNDTVKVAAVFTEAGFEIASGKGVTPKHGYAFKEWTPQLTLLLNVTGDAVYTATYTAKDPVVDTDPKDPDYVQVTFAPGEHAAFVAGAVKENVWALKGIPASQAFTHAGVAYDSAKNMTVEEGYTFSHYNDNADAKVIATTKIPAAAVTYTAAQLENIIDNPTDPTPPGYHRVTFSAEAGGTFAAGAITVFDVLDGVVFPAAKAPIVTANAGQEYTGWDPVLPFAVKADTTVKAQYRETTVPVIDPETPTPDGYIRVTLKPGAHGTLTAAKDTALINGEVILDVKDGTAILDKYVPTIVPADTHVADGWDPAIDTVVTADTKVFTAKYKQKVIPVDDPEKPVPDGYARVTFTTDAAKGPFQAGAITMYDVLLGETLPADHAPGLDVVAGQNHTGWNPTGPWTVTAATTVAANFADKPAIVDEDPKDPDYAKVTFLAGDGGTFANADKKTVWALKGTGAAAVFDHAGLAISDATGIHVQSTKLFANYSDGAATVEANATIPAQDVIYTATYTDKEAGLKPSGLTQQFDKDADKQYIDGKIDGFTPGTDTTDWEIILTDVNGNPILDGGDPIKGTINDDGTFEFPINKDVLAHDQQVNAQLTEPNKLPVRADKLVTLDLEGPSITEITATPSAGILEITAKTDDPTAAFVVVVGDQTYPATVDAQGVITARVPAAGMDEIVIKGVDPLGNANIGDGIVERPTEEPEQFSFEVQAAYAGNRRLTVYGGPEMVLDLRILRDGEVFVTRQAKASKTSGRATIVVPALELGDVIEIIGTSNTGITSETFIMEITE